ncbi:histidine kinase dimerization/phospho-acceptor domain-containing protein [Rhodanobacter sp. BL-MT-08]
MIRSISIRLRITLFLVMAIVLTLGTATWLLDEHIDDEVALQADTNLLERAQALSDIFRMQPLAEATQKTRLGRLPEFLADDGEVHFIIHCRGQTVLSSPAAAALAWPAPVTGKPAFADISDGQKTDLRAVSLLFNPSLEPGLGGRAASATAGTARCNLGLAVDLKAVRTFQTSMDRIEYGCILIAVLIVVLLTPLLIRRGLKPLARLAEGMRLIGPESPDQRLDTDSAAELQPLIARFNEVLSRMQEGLMRERQFASGVAHELRTPLAEMHTMIEVELRYPSQRDLRAFLADIGTIGMEMERLVTALLLLTRIEAGIEQVQYQAVDVGALTGKLLDRHRDDLKRRHLELVVRTQGTLIWQADPTLLEVTLGNLLGNAVAYAPTGSSLLLDYQSNTWLLQNDAPGLDDDDVALMHRRFWRKGKDAGVHTGLGVALVAAAANAQSMHLDLSLVNGRLRAAVTTDRPTSLSAGGAKPSIDASFSRPLTTES